MVNTMSASSVIKYSDDEINIRPARKEDMATVVKMIQRESPADFQELADFEKMPEGPKMSVEELERDGFESSPPAFCCSVAELAPARSGPSVAPVVVGYALFFPTYSTWQGRSMMLEDLYVRPSERRKGVGQRLFCHVAKEAAASGCSRLDFHVLEWNEARRFYESRGAVNLTGAEQWCYYRLAGDALHRLTRTPEPLEDAPKP